MHHPVQKYTEIMISIAQSFRPTKTGDKKLYFDRLNMHLQEILLQSKLMNGSNEDHAFF